MMGVPNGSTITQFTSARKPGANRTRSSLKRKAQTLDETVVSPVPRKSLRVRRKTEKAKRETRVSDQGRITDFYDSSTVEQNGEVESLLCQDQQGETSSSEIVLDEPSPSLKEIESLEFEDDQEECVEESITESPMEEIEEIYPEEPEMDEEEQRLALYKETQALIDGDFVLPFHYDVLLHVFQSLQNSLLYLSQRSARKSWVSFDTLKHSIELACKKEFTTERLAQILYILPDTVSVRMHQQINPAEGHGSSWMLVVELDRFKKGIVEAGSTNAWMCERYAQFKHALYERVHSMHKQFIKEETDDIEMLPYLRSWHADFKINEIPPVPMAPLPQPPKASKASILSQMNDHVSETLLRHESTASSNSVDPLPLHQSLSKVDSGILSRVRERESQVKRRDNVLGSRDDRALRVLIGELPDLATEIRQYFISTHKTRYRWEQLRDYLSSRPGRSTLMSTEMDKRMDLLTKLAPDWCKQRKVGKLTIFQIYETTKSSKIFSKCLEELNRISFEEVQRILKE